MGRALATIGLLLAAPCAATAATLPIGGSYGNDRGCALARTGAYDPVDGVYLLTPNEIATSVTLCSFDAVSPAPGGGHHVRMTCSSEGSGPEDDTTEAADISGSADAGYTIRFADGTTWGPLARC
jgi:hypothetical protein